MKEILLDFLTHINDECTDEYGNLQVLISQNEQIKKDYYSQTPEGIVENYMSIHNLH